MSTPIGYVMPEPRYQGWAIGGAGSETAAATLVSAVERHGLPFMRSLTALQRVREAMSEGLGIGHNVLYRLPVILLLLGEHDEAFATLECSHAEMSDRTDPAAEEFRRFATAFRRRRE